MKKTRRRPDGQWELVVKVQNPMTEEQREIASHFTRPLARLPRRKPSGYSVELRWRNAMMFTMLDMAECELVDIEQVCKREGYCVKNEIKRAMNAIKHNLKVMRRELAGTDEEKQEAVGNSADLFRLIIWRIMLNCTHEPVRYFYTYNAIKAMYKSSDEIDLSREEQSVLSDLMERVEYEKQHKA